MSCIPNSLQRWVTNMSNSSKEFSSSSTSIRSRAVSLPFACWAAIRFSPPPSRASARRSSSSARMSLMRASPRPDIPGPCATKPSSDQGIVWRICKSSCIRRLQIAKLRIMAEARKLYAGAKLREIRTRLGLRQADFATRLGVSVSYLNQMENNHRPIPARLVVALAEQFGLDVTELAAGTTERVIADLREALADPACGEAPPMADLQPVAANAPNFARAFLALHRAHRESGERLAQLNEALGREDAPLAPLPWEEVRDFFHYCDNYIDAIDRAAERFAAETDGPDRRAALVDWLESRHGITVTLERGGPLRRYDPENRRLTLDAAAGRATHSFQIL